jgi:mannose-6-phosphate isomerase-like protein (cupin superfamily)
MKVINFEAALKRLPKLNDEIRYKNCFQAKTFTSGLIAFRPNKNSDAKQIIHTDKDVVCQVLKGRGQLRINRRRIQLRPGTICHVPRGTPHDFAAGKGGELVLFYSLIKTG